MKTTRLIPVLLLIAAVSPALADEEAPKDEAATKAAAKTEKALRKLEKQNAEWCKKQHAALPLTCFTCEGANPRNAPPEKKVAKLVAKLKKKNAKWCKKYKVPLPGLALDCAGAAVACSGSTSSSSSGYAPAVSSSSGLARALDATPAVSRPNAATAR